MTDVYSELPEEQKNILKVALQACAYHCPGRKPRGELYRPVQKLTARLVPRLDDCLIRTACVDLGWDFDEVILLPVTHPLIDSIRMGGWRNRPLNGGKSRAEKYDAGWRKMPGALRQQHAQAMLRLAELRPSHPIITEIIHRVDIKEAASLRPFEHYSLIEELG